MFPRSNTIISSTVHITKSNHSHPSDLSIRSDEKEESCEGPSEVLRRSILTSPFLDVSYTSGFPPGLRKDSTPNESRILEMGHLVTYFNLDKDGPDYATRGAFSICLLGKGLSGSHPSHILDCFH